MRKYITLEIRRTSSPDFDKARQYVRNMKPKKLVDTYCEMYEMTQALAEAEVASRIDPQASAYEQLTADAEDFFLDAISQTQKRWDAWHDDDSDSGTMIFLSKTDAFLIPEDMDGGWIPYDAFKRYLSQPAGFISAKP